MPNRAWLVSLKVRREETTTVLHRRVEASGPRAASGAARADVQADGWRVLKMVEVKALN